MISCDCHANEPMNLWSERLDKEIDQIALTYTFKSAVPNPADIFDASFLPAAAERKLD